MANEPAYTTKEVLSVAGSSTALTAATYLNSRHALITVETVPIRFWKDGSTPTATQGHLCEPGAVIPLANQDQIRKFRAIAPAGTATLMVSYGVK